MRVLDGKNDTLPDVQTCLHTNTSGKAIKE
jgi:hypothetical protein